MPKIGTVPRLNFRGVYSAASTYALNDLVTYSGSTYIAVAATTGNDPTNTTYWAQFATGAGVIAGGTTGQVLAKNSGTDFDTVWATAGGGSGNTNYRGDWTNGFVYAANDVISVVHGGSGQQSMNLFICTQAHTASTGTFPLVTMTTPWRPMSSALTFKGTWSSATYYPRDVVFAGTSLWVMTSNTATTLNPTSQTQTVWTQMVWGVRPQGTYLSTSAYLPGDVVSYLGGLYVCVQKNTTTSPQAPNAYSVSSGNSLYWTWVAAVSPPGGAAGQVLTKNSGTDFDLSWKTYAANTAGFFPGWLPGGAHWYSHPQGQAGTVVSYTTANTWGYPLRIPNACTINRIGAFLGTAAGNITVALHNDTGTGQPSTAVSGSLLTISGNVSTFCQATYGSPLVFTGPADVWVVYSLSATTQIYGSSNAGLINSTVSGATPGTTNNGLRNIPSTPGTDLSGFGAVASAFAYPSFWFYVP